jgi:tryptophan synthase alpha chain
VGFGISTPEQAHAVARFADGVIVGGVLVKLLEEEGINALQGFSRNLAIRIHEI